MKNCSVQVTDFTLAETLDCGQCFRWYRDENGAYTGVVGQNRIKLIQNGDILEMIGCDCDDFDSWLGYYLGLDEDYKTYKSILSQDKTLADAISYAPGIRVMRQDFWETLCSFILSINTNIPRIMGMIDRFCEAFGTDCGGYYSFPDAGRVSKLTAADLAPVRAGFRDNWIIDAAKKYTDGAIDISFIKTAPLGEARAMLMQINGVGPKVADCVLLFGAGRHDAFPEDVWIKRAMAHLFPDGLPEYAKPIAGIAQQYIFHYARTSGLFAK